MPNLPMLVLSLVIATLYSSLFHLRWGKTLRELFISWVAALLGFASGQLLASAFSWRDVLIGELHFVTATVACWLFMALAKRLKS